MAFKDFFPDIVRLNRRNATKAKILIYVIYYSLLLCCCLLTMSIMGYLPSKFPFPLIIGVLFGLLVVFRYTNSLSLTANLFLGMIAYFEMSSSLVSGGIYSVDNFFLYIIPLAAYVLSEARSASLWLLVINVWAIYLFSLAGSPENIQSFRDQTVAFQPAYYLGFCITSSLFSFGLISIFYLENRNLIKKLEDNQTALEHKNKAYAQQTDQLVTIQNRLKNSNRELEQYAYVVSHDLKQPIKTVDGFANLLKKDLERKEVLDAENSMFLNLIIKSSNNMLRLVNDLLVYARLVALKDVPFEKLDLDEVLNNVLDSLQNQIDSNEVCIERSELPSLEVVPVKINQVFQNIISNAIKFKKKTEPLKIKIHSRERETHCELVIEDNGIGIDKKNQEKIFAPFKKLHKAEEYAGSGIGLATCKRIIEMHKGEIWVESEKDKGTKFVFTLPRIQAN